MSGPFREMQERIAEHKAFLAAAEEACEAQGWRFLGVHLVSGAWSAKPKRPSAATTVKSARALTFAEFAFAFLEAAEKREEEIAERARCKEVCRAAGFSFRGVHEGEEGFRWVARRKRTGEELSATSGAELRKLLEALPQLASRQRAKVPKGALGRRNRPALTITTAEGVVEELSEHHPYAGYVLEELGDG